MAPDAPVALVVENAADDPAGPLGEWLTDAGLRLEVVRPYTGAALPVGLDGYDALVVLGGAMAAYDDESVGWLAALKGLLREAVGTGLPVLAVCLGAQLLADATGGRVGPAGERRRWAPVWWPSGTVRSTTRCSARCPVTPDVLQWHHDAVTELPPGAVLLAASPRCVNQAFRVGSRRGDVQFHIETTPDVVRTWALAEADYLAENGIDLETLLARVEAAHPDLQEVWAPVAARFAELARRAGRGPVGPR